MSDDQNLPPLFYTDRAEEFLNDVHNKKRARKQNSSIDKDERKRIGQRGVKSLTRISKLNPKEFIKNDKVLTYFKKRVNYGNMNNLNYDPNEVMSNPDLILKTLTEMQQDGFSRNAKKMLFSDKLLDAISKTKTPSVRSIYTKGFKTEEEHHLLPQSYRYHPDK